jgi:ABC-type polysaccharide/polyol phosphate export permease
MAGVIEGMRWAMTSRSRPDAGLMLASGAVVVVVLLSGLWYFRRNEGIVVDVV